jgi:hypothetical protein
MRKTKKIDKRMDQLRKEFKKSSLVLKKNKAGLKKSASAARFAASLSSEQMMASVLTYLATIIALGSKHKAAVKAMLEDTLPDVDVEPLIGSLNGLVHDLQSPLMESEYDGEFDSLFWDLEPILLEMMEAESQKLSVAQLNEEVQKLKTKKAVSSDKSTKELSPKEQRLRRFYKFFTLFQNKMAEYQVQSDEKIAKFLTELINLVNRVRISKSNEEVKSHAK